MRDGKLYRDLFATPEMRVIWSEDRTIELWLRVERAIALSQAELGLVAQGVADAVGSVTRDQLDRDRLVSDMAVVGRPIVGLVKQLRERAGAELEADVHKGVTTQDLMDTATVLQMRASLTLVHGQLDAVLAELARLRGSHGEVEMVGRTNGQHAVPIPFDAKLVSWESELRRRKAALDDAGRRGLMLQLGGPVGTLSSFPGTVGTQLWERIADRLGLPGTRTNWQSARDGVAEIVQAVGLLSASLARVAHNVNLLSGTDIAEVFERGGDGLGASSSMAHKRNQRASEFAEAVARLARQRSEQIGEVTLHEHERSGGVWIAEWMIVPEAFLFASGALKWSERMLKALEIDRERINANLRRSALATT